MCVGRGGVVQLPRPYGIHLVYESWNVIKNDLSQGLLELVENKKLTIIIQGFHITRFFLIHQNWLVKSSLIMYG
jgi:hypothetical protein